jgi:hypothetical protein
VVQDFLIVFLSTALITLAVYWKIGGERPGMNRFIFFLSLLLGTWAGGLWIMPFVKSVSGVYWMSFVVVALLYTAVVYFIIWTLRRPETRGEALRRTEAIKETNILLQVILTVVLVVSLVFVMFRYTH